MIDGMFPTMAQAILLSNSTLDHLQYDGSFQMFYLHNKEEGDSANDVENKTKVEAEMENILNEFKGTFRKPKFLPPILYRNN